MNQHKDSITKTVGITIIGIAVTVSSGLFAFSFATLINQEPIDVFANDVVQQVKEGISYEVSKPNVDGLVEDTESNRYCTYEEAKLDKPVLPRRLSIPSQGISMSVVFTPLQNGTWDVKNYYANFAEGTSLINGTSGNTGLFGHDRVGQFRNIKNLRLGDMIYIYTDNYRVTYSVVRGFTTTPDNVQVFYPTNEPLVTLVTCNGPSSEMRYTVQARLEKVEKVNCYDIN